MFGNEQTEKLVLAGLCVVFLVCALVDFSIWLTVFFGLLAALQAVGLLGDMTTVWCLRAPPRGHGGHGGHVSGGVQSQRRWPDNEE